MKTAGGMASSTLLATLSSWWSDPSLLCNAAPPAAVSAAVSVNGNQLTVLAGSALSGSGTLAAFQAQTTNPGNSFKAGILRMSWLLSIMASLSKIIDVHSQSILAFGESAPVQLATGLV